VRPGQARRRGRHRGQPERVAEERVDLAPQALGRQLAVADHDGRPAVGHPARVGGLVVGRRVGIGHEDRRAPVGATSKIDPPDRATHRSQAARASPKSDRYSRRS
jgi:hypothetical protein